MEKNLPKGWIEVQLIELLDSLETGARPKGGVQGILDGIPSIGGEHLNSDGGFKLENIKFVPSEFAKTLKRGRIIEKDILIVKDGATTGKTSYVDENFPFNQAFVNEHVFLCRPSGSIYSKCLYYYLRSPIGQERVMNNFAGAAQGGINTKFAKNTLVPLPPLAEQQRIVAKLDRLFGQLDRLNARMERIPQLLKDFRQKVLSQAVTGKLTEEWREGKKLGEWSFTKLKDICNSITDGDHQAPPKASDGVPFLVISNVSSGNFDFDSVTRFVPIEYFNSLKENRIPRKGDVLYTVTGSFGIPLLVDFEMEFCFQRHIAILKPNNNRIISPYLKFFLQSFNALSQAIDVATGTAQLTVPLNGLRNFEIELPPLEEQQEIVRRVESLFAKADRIEAGYQQLRAKVAQLPQALLAKAFRGELVEQLPTDGDARALLQQIKQVQKGLEKYGNTKAKCRKE